MRYLLLSIALCAAWVQAAPKYSKPEKKPALAGAADDGAFDPLDAEAAKEYGISDKRLKKIEDFCKTRFRDPLCVKRRDEKAAQARAKAAAAKARMTKDAASKRAR